jgi:hypothetical protein
MIIAIRPHEIYELLSILEMLHCQSPCFHGQIQHLYSYDKAYRVSFAFWFLWGAQTTILSYQRFCCGAPKKSCCQPTKQPCSSSTWQTALRVESQELVPGFKSSIEKSMNGKVCLRTHDFVSPLLFVRK